jgi:hypothetical protein
MGAGAVTSPPAEPDLEADDTLAGETDADDTLADEQENTETGEDAAAVTGAAPSESMAARGRRRLQLDNTPVAVPSGQALTATEASAVLAQHPAELVVAVAEVDVGKTTLFASMYEHLARAPLGGWTFDGSMSLLGFESRSFDATRASGHTAELTNRTSRDTPRIALHLAVRSRSGERRQLLLGDISGEHAATLIDFGDAGDFTPLLRAATRLLVLIDGAKLRGTADQNATLSRIRVLIRALVEGKDLRAGVPLDLVVTKWDQCGDADGLAGELDRLLSFTEERWQPVSLHRTAARPHGDGVAELFATLLSPRPSRPERTWDVPAATRPLHEFRPHNGLASRFLAAQARGSA